MDFILVLFIFVILFLIQKTNKIDSVSNITLLLFNIYWFFSLGLSTTGLNNFFIPQTTTLLMLLCGVCTFNWGFYRIRISRMQFQNFDAKILAKSFDVVFSSTWLKIVVIFAGLYVIYILTQYYQIIVLEQVSGAEIRESQSNQTFDLDVPYSSYFSFIFPWLIPLTRVLFCYSILYKRNLYAIALFVLLFGYSSLSFGRMMYLIALLPIILIIGLFQSKNNKIIISKKQRVFFMGLLIAVIGALSFVSTLRLGSYGDSSLEDGFEMLASQVTDYSSGAVVGFDAALRDNYVDKTGGLKYGMVTLWPYLFPLTSISHIVGSTRYATGEWAYLSDYIEHSYPKVRTNGGTWNGLFTWDILFYNDFGFFGVLLYNLLFGIIMRYCIKRVYTNQSFMSVVVCSIFFIISVLSPTKLWEYDILFGVVLFIFVVVDIIQSKRKSKLFINNN